MLIDTCVLSELARPCPDARVVAWFDAAPEADLRLSVLTVGEIARGVERLPASKRRRELEAWLASLRVHFADRLVAVDERVALLWARLAAEAEARGRVLHTVDGLLAATALRHAMPLVTRNVDNFTVTGVELQNPWASV